LAPLVRRSTYLRGVHLLLGAIVLLPYILLGIAFAQLLTNPDVPRAGSLVLLAVALTIAAVPPFLAGTRALEIVAARRLLDVNLPDPVDGAPSTANRGCPARCGSPSIWRSAVRWRWD
jgi:hypothetical protein